MADTLSRVPGDGRGRQGAEKVLASSVPACTFFLFPVGRNGAVEQPANPPASRMRGLGVASRELGVRGVARGRISRWVRGVRGESVGGGKSLRGGSRGGGGGPQGKRGAGAGSKDR